VTVIKKEAFKGCESIITLTISSSVSYLGHSAFEDCKNLKSVIIPSSVTTICAVTVKTSASGHPV